MKNTFIISLLLVLIIGCSTKSRKQEEIRNLHIKDSLKLVYERDSIQKVKLEKEQQLIQVLPETKSTQLLVSCST